MPRPPTGQLIVRRGKRDTTFAARVRAQAGRHFVVLGYATEGMTERTAEEALQNLMADVRRGFWRPPNPESVFEGPAEDPDFHTFASGWLETRRHEVGPRTVEHWEWALSCHLLPTLKDHCLSAITMEEVDRYKASKLRERERYERASPEHRKKLSRPLSNSSINKTLKVLAQVLETAVDCGRIESNPAAGKRRRLKAEKPRRTWLEPDEVWSLLAPGAIIGCWSRRWCSPACV